MPSLKDLRVRIASVRSTQKITSAMKMVASAKLKKAQVAAESGRPYASSMERMLASLTSGLQASQAQPKLLSGHGVEDKVHLLVLVTGDRGLCGGFNSSIVRRARQRVIELQSQNKQVKLFCIGRKGRDGIKRDFASLIIETRDNVTRNGAEFGSAREIARRLNTLFEDHAFDVCSIIFNTFKSAMTQTVTMKQIIPFPKDDLVGGTGMSAGYELEPDDDVLLASLLPANLSMQVYRSLLESYASEQGARMTAMDNATRNAGDMINRLTLTYNRSRQAAITRELIEIISGAEAL